MIAPTTLSLYYIYSKKKSKYLFYTFYSIIDCRGIYVLTVTLVSLTTTASLMLVPGILSFEGRFTTAALVVRLVERDEGLETLPDELGFLLGLRFILDDKGKQLRMY